MRLFILIILFSACSTVKKVDPLSVPVMGNVYYSGCMGGVVAIHELGYRNEKDLNTEKGWKNITDHCKFQQIKYEYFLNKGLKK